MRNSRSKSILSLLMAVLMAANPIVSPLAHSAEVAVSSGFHLDLPTDLGTIQALHAGQGPTLIHIQDAHGNYEAQKKIKDILHYLKQVHGVRLLLLEGSAFKLRPELTRLFPRHMDITKEVLDELAKDAVAQGEELFLAETDGVEAYGIENLEAYLANGEAFKAVLLQQEKTQGFIQDMDMQIERLTSPYLNKDLRAFVKRLEFFVGADLVSARQTRGQAQGLPLLLDHLVYLKNRAKEYLKIDLSDPAYQIDWPTLLRIFKLGEFETKIDMRAFGKERDEFLSVLENRLRHPEGRRPEGSEILRFAQDDFGQIQSLLSSPLSRHRLPDPETSLLFEKMVAALPADFDYDIYPNVKYFIGHLILQSEVKAGRLMKEMARLTDQISDKLAKTKEEKKILSLLKDHRLLKKLFALELAPEDYESIQNGHSESAEGGRRISEQRSFARPSASLRMTSLKPSHIIQRFLALNAGKRVRNIEFKHVEEIDSLFDKALEFYQGVKERDRWMLQNIEARLKETGVDKAVVITGGFHTGPFQNFFETRGFNYALIAPKISSSEGREAYIHSILDFQIKTHKAVQMLSFNGPELRMQGVNPRLVSRALLEKSIGVAGRHKIPPLVFHQMLPDSRFHGSRVNLASASSSRAEVHPTPTESGTPQHLRPTGASTKVSLATLPGAPQSFGRSGRRAEMRSEDKEHEQAEDLYRNTHIPGDLKGPRVYAKARLEELKTERSINTPSARKEGERQATNLYSNSYIRGGLKGPSVYARARLQELETEKLAKRAEVRASGLDKIEREIEKLQQTFQSGKVPKKVEAKFENLHGRLKKFDDVVKSGLLQIDLRVGEGSYDQEYAREMTRSFLKQSKKIQNLINSLSSLERKIQKRNLRAEVREFPTVSRRFIRSAFRQVVDEEIRNYKVGGNIHSILDVFLYSPRMRAFLRIGTLEFMGNKIIQRGFDEVIEKIRKRSKAPYFTLTREQVHLLVKGERVKSRAEVRASKRIKEGYLQGIRLYVETLLDDNALPEQTRHALDRIGALVAKATEASVSREDFLLEVDRISKGKMRSAIIEGNIDAARIIIYDVYRRAEDFDSRAEARFAQSEALSVSRRAKVHPDPTDPGTPQHLRPTGASTEVSLAALPGAPQSFGRSGRRAEVRMKINPFLTDIQEQIREAGRILGKNPQEIADLIEPEHVYAHWLETAQPLTRGRKERFLAVRVQHRRPLGEDGRPERSQGGIRIILPEILGEGPDDDTSAFYQAVHALKPYLTGDDQTDMNILTRFTKKWIVDEAKALAMGMSFKNKVAGLPLGGGKGAILLANWENVEGEWTLVPINNDKFEKKDVAVIMRDVARAFAKDGIIFETVDGGAPDVNPFKNFIGTSELMGWLVDETLEYLMEQPRHPLWQVEPELLEILRATPDSLVGTPYLDATMAYALRTGHPIPVISRYTGKKVGQGGSLYRDKSTGEGAVMAAETLVRKLYPERADSPRPLEGFRVAIQGFGNAAIFAAYRLAVKQGARIIAVSDSGGAIIKRGDGFFTEEEIGKLVRLKEGTTEKKSVIDAVKTRNGDYRVQGARILGKGALGNAKLLELPVDLLIPAALENQINESNVDRVKARIVSEAANGPTAKEAMQKAFARPKEKRTYVIPFILASAGGVAISSKEIEQNVTNRYLSEEELRQWLEQQMQSAVNAVWQVHEERKVDLGTAAFLLGMQRLTPKAPSRSRRRSEARLPQGGGEAEGSPAKKAAAEARDIHLPSQPSLVRDWKNKVGEVVNEFVKKLVELNKNQNFIIGAELEGLPVPQTLQIKQGGVIEEPSAFGKIVQEALDQDPRLSNEKKFFISPEVEAEHVVIRIQRSEGDDDFQFIGGPDTVEFIDEDGRSSSRAEVRMGPLTVKRGEMVKDAVISLRPLEDGREELEIKTPAGDSILRVIGYLDNSKLPERIPSPEIILGDDAKDAIIVAGPNYIELRSTSGMIITRIDGFLGQNVSEVQNKSYGWPAVSITDKMRSIIREAMERQGRSATAVAAEAGISTGYLSNIMTGSKKSARLKVLLKLQQVLAMDLQLSLMPKSRSEARASRRELKRGDLIPGTRFRLGGPNGEKEILSLRKWPEYEEHVRQMRPGGHNSGYLGTHEDLVDVLLEDYRTLQKLGYTAQQLADWLRQVPSIFEGEHLVNGQKIVTDGGEIGLSFGESTSPLPGIWDSESDFVLQNLTTGFILPGVVTDTHPDLIDLWGFFEGHAVVANPASLESRVASEWDPKEREILKIHLRYDFRLDPVDLVALFTGRPVEELRKIAERKTNPPTNPPNRSSKARKAKGQDRRRSEARAKPPLRDEDFPPSKSEGYEAFKANLQTYWQGAIFDTLFQHEVPADPGRMRGVALLYEQQGKFYEAAVVRFAEAIEVIKQKLTEDLALADFRKEVEDLLDLAITNAALRYRSLTDWDNSKAIQLMLDIDKAKETARKEGWDAEAIRGAIVTLHIYQSFEGYLDVFLAILAKKFNESRSEARASRRELKRGDLIPKTKFRLGGPNGEEAILSLRNWPEYMKRVYEMRPEGFLGEKEDLVEVLLQDHRTMEALGTTPAELANWLRAVVATDDGIDADDFPIPPFTGEVRVNGQFIKITGDFAATAFGSQEPPLPGPINGSDQDGVVKNVKTGFIMPGVLTHMHPDLIELWGFFEGHDIYRRLERVRFIGESEGPKIEVSYRLDPVDVYALFTGQPVEDLRRKVREYLSTSRAEVRGWNDMWELTTAFFNEIWKRPKRPGLEKKPAPLSNRLRWQAEREAEIKNALVKIFHQNVVEERREAALELERLTKIHPDPRLEDKDSSVQITAARTLSRISREADSMNLVGAVGPAARLLKKEEAARAREALTRLLDRESDPSVRKAAAQALAALGPKVLPRPETPSQKDRIKKWIEFTAGLLLIYQHFYIKQNKTPSPNEMVELLEALIRDVKDPMEGYQALGLVDLNQIQDENERRFVGLIRKLDLKYPSAKITHVDLDTQLALSELIALSDQFSRSEARGLSAVNFPAVTDRKNQNAVAFPVKNNSVISHAESVSSRIRPGNTFGEDKRVGLREKIFKLVNDLAPDVLWKFQEGPLGVGGKIIRDHARPDLRLTSLPEMRPERREFSSVAAKDGLKASTSSSISSRVSRSSTSARVLPLRSTSRTMPLRANGSLAARVESSRTTFSSDKLLSNGTMVLPPDEKKYNIGRPSPRESFSRRPEVRADKVVFSPRVFPSESKPTFKSKRDRTRLTRLVFEYALGTWPGDLHSALFYLAINDPVDFRDWKTGKMIRFQFRGKDFGFMVSEPLQKDFKPFLIKVARGDVDLNQLTDDLLTLMVGLNLLRLARKLEETGERKLEPSMITADEYETIQEVVTQAREREFRNIPPRRRAEVRSEVLSAETGFQDFVVYLDKDRLGIGHSAGSPKWLDGNARPLNQEELKLIASAFGRHAPLEYRILNRGREYDILQFIHRVLRRVLVDLYPNPTHPHLSDVLVPIFVPRFFRGSKIKNYLQSLTEEISELKKLGAHEALIRTIHNAGSSIVFPRLRKALNSRIEKVKLEAIRLVPSLSPQVSQKALNRLAALLQDPSPAIRGAAGRSLNAFVRQQIAAQKNILSGRSEVRAIDSQQADVPMIIGKDGQTLPEDKTQNVPKTPEKVEEETPSQRALRHIRLTYGDPSRPEARSDSDSFLQLPPGDWDHPTEGMFRLPTVGELLGKGKRNKNYRKKLSELPPLKTPLARELAEIMSRMPLDPKLDQFLAGLHLDLSASKKMPGETEKKLKSVKLKLKTLAQAARQLGYFAIEEILENELLVTLDLAFGDPFYANYQESLSKDLRSFEKYLEQEILFYSKLGSASTFALSKGESFPLYDILIKNLVVTVKGFGKDGDGKNQVTLVRPRTKWEVSLTKGQGIDGENVLYVAKGFEGEGEDRRVIFTEYPLSRSEARTINPRIGATTKKPAGLNPQSDGLITYSSLTYPSPFDEGNKNLSPNKVLVKDKAIGSLRPKAPVLKTAPSNRKYIYSKVSNYKIIPPASSFSRSEAREFETFDPQADIGVVAIGAGALQRGEHIPMLQELYDRGLYKRKVVVVQASGRGDKDIAGYLKSDAVRGDYPVRILHPDREDEIVRMKGIVAAAGALGEENGKEKFLSYAKRDLDLILLNVTESGLKEEAPIMSDLTDFLYAFYQAHRGEKEITILDADNEPWNGNVIQKSVLALAQKKQLGHDFIEWLDQKHGVHFLNTVVDRIAEKPEKDNPDKTPALEPAEGLPFRMAILDLYGSKALQKIPFTRIPDVDVYQKREDLEKIMAWKYQILNALHSAQVYAADLAGLSTVYESVTNPVIAEHLRHLIEKDIVPAIQATHSIEGKDPAETAARVMKRFKNPKIKHKPKNILINAMDKARIRFLPTLLTRKEEASQNLAYAFAVLFYHLTAHGEETRSRNPGEKIPQELETLRKPSAGPSKIENIVNAVLNNPDYWNGNKIQESYPNFAAQIVKFYTNLYQDRGALDLLEVVNELSRRGPEAQLPSVARRPEARLPQGGGEAEGSPAKKAAAEVRNWEEALQTKLEPLREPAKTILLDPDIRKWNPTVDKKTAANHVDIKAIWPDEGYGLMFSIHYSPFPVPGIYLLTIYESNSPALTPPAFKEVSWVSFEPSLRVDAADEIIPRIREELNRIRQIPRFQWLTGRPEARSTEHFQPDLQKVRDVLEKLESRFNELTPPVTDKNQPLTSEQKLVVTHYSTLFHFLEKSSGTEWRRSSQAYRQIRWSIFILPDDPMEALNDLYEDLADAYLQFIPVADKGSFLTPDIDFSVKGGVPYEDYWPWVMVMSMHGGQKALRFLGQELDHVGNEIFDPQAYPLSNNHWSAAYQEILLEGIFLARTYDEKDIELKKSILEKASHSNFYRSRHITELAGYLKGLEMKKSTHSSKDHKILWLYRNARLKSEIYDYTEAVFIDKKNLFDSKPIVNQVQNDSAARSEARVSIREFFIDYIRKEAALRWQPAWTLEEARKVLVGEVSFQKAAPETQSLVKEVFEAYFRYPLRDTYWQLGIPGEQYWVLNGSGMKLKVSKPDAASGRVTVTIETRKFPSPGRQIVFSPTDDPLIESLLDLERTQQRNRKSLFKRIAEWFEDSLLLRIFLIGWMVSSFVVPFLWVSIHAFALSKDLLHVADHVMTREALWGVIGLTVIWNWAGVLVILFITEIEDFFTSSIPRKLNRLASLNPATAADPSETAVAQESLVRLPTLKLELDPAKTKEIIQHNLAKIAPWLEETKDGSPDPASISRSAGLQVSFVGEILGVNPLRGIPLVTDQVILDVTPSGRLRLRPIEGRLRIDHLAWRILSVTLAEYHRTIPRPEARLPQGGGGAEGSPAKKAVAEVHPDPTDPGTPQSFGRSGRRAEVRSGGELDKTKQILSRLEKVQDAIGINPDVLDALSDKQIDPRARQVSVSRLIKKLNTNTPRTEDVEEAKGLLAELEPIVGLSRPAPEKSPRVPLSPESQEPTFKDPVAYRAYLNSLLADLNIADPDRELVGRVRRTLGDPGRLTKIVKEIEGIESIKKFDSYFKSATRIADQYTNNPKSLSDGDRKTLIEFLVQAWQAARAETRMTTNQELQDRLNRIVGEIRERLAAAYPERQNEDIPLREVLRSSQSGERLLESSFTQLDTLLGRVGKDQGIAVEIVDKLRKARQQAILRNQGEVDNLFESVTALIEKLKLARSEVRSSLSSRTRHFDERRIFDVSGHIQVTTQIVERILNGTLQTITVYGKQIDVKESTRAAADQIVAEVNRRIVWPPNYRRVWSLDYSTLTISAPTATGFESQGPESLTEISEVESEQLRNAGISDLGKLLSYSRTDLLSQFDEGLVDRIKSSLKERSLALREEEKTTRPEVRVEEKVTRAPVTKTPDQLVSLPRDVVIGVDSPDLLPRLSFESLTESALGLRKIFTDSLLALILVEEISEFLKRGGLLDQVNERLGIPLVYAAVREAVLPETAPSFRASEAYRKAVKARFAAIPDSESSLIIDGFWLEKLQESGIGLLNLFEIGEARQSAMKVKEPVFLFVGDGKEIRSGLKYALTHQNNGLTGEDRIKAINFANRIDEFVRVIQPERGETPLRAMNRTIQENQGVGSLTSAILEGLKGDVNFVGDKKLAKDIVAIPFVIERILYAAAQFNGLRKLDPQRPAELLQAELIRKLGIIVNIVRQSGQSFLVIQSIEEFMASLLAQRFAVQKSA